MMRTKELLLYRQMEDGQILKDMTFLMENYKNEYYNKEDLKELLFETLNRLLELAVSHGFAGNLWHTYLTYLLPAMKMPTALPARSWGRRKAALIVRLCMIL